MTYLENNVREDLNSDIYLILDKKVTYSRTGGGASSILLIIFENDCRIWAWRYWEISQGDTLLACANDDDTPITGKMAMAAQSLEGLKIIDIRLVKNSLNLGILFEDSKELWLYTEVETNKDLLSLINWEIQFPTFNLCYIINSKRIIEKTNYYESEPGGSRDQRDFEHS